MLSLALDSVNPHPIRLHPPLHPLHIPEQLRTPTVSLFILMSFAGTHCNTVSAFTSLMQPVNHHLHLSITALQCAFSPYLLAQLTAFDLSPAALCVQCLQLVAAHLLCHRLLHDYTAW